MSSIFNGVLKFSNFRRIWFSQIFSQVAVNMLNFAIILHIYDLTGSITSISLVLIASAIPSVLFGPFSGAIADRLNYKSILIYTNFLRFLAVLLLFFGYNNLLALLEIIFLISTITQFFSPAEMSSIPLIVPKKKLVSANSVIMTTMYGSLLIGYSIAGPIMTLVSAQWLFLLAGVLFLLATLAVSSMTKYDNKKIKNISLSTIAMDLENIWFETKEGIKYIRSNYKILNPMLKLTAGWVVLGSMIVLLPGFGENVLGINPKFVGPAVIGPAGVGMIVGAAFLNRKKSYRFNFAINKSFFAAGVVMILFSSYRFYEELSFARILSIALTILIGFTSSIIYISAQTLLHLNSKENLRGRVFGIVSMLLNLAISIPALIIGGVADLTSPFFAMILISFAALIYGTSLLFEE